MVELKNLSTGNYTPDWCPGCGDYIILNALKRAIVKLNLNPNQVVVVSGIGCSSKLPQWINTFGYHGVHGRGLPVGTGIKIANKKLHVIVIGGDGDIYGEGMNHFIQSLRKNIDITLLVHDNQIYGLTKGQTSPTSMHGDKSVTSQIGNFDEPVNPIALAVAQKTSFIARSFAGDLEHLTNTIADAVSFKGFSFVDMFQPCVTFNKHNTYDWFKERVYDLQKKGYKPNNLERAFKKSIEFGDKIPIGVFFKEKKELYEETHPVLKKTPLVKQSLKNISIKKLMEEFC
ncbi:2-oxoacid ferredoxin oxidoreductase [Candidatus Woesearchaeota archaeon]|jgi:2-oxoglutarate ferredoxin oxidoreductase subunit beta|nr:2-oxoacid ferredoxin oxidoreductase [Candidatus Woesearchaeota archaeon]|tara:strand:- start:2077 stop:2937 length:861 start_codon:yes stop_codon:yes gene_type:complete